MNPYEKAMKASVKMNEHNDCAVITTSVLTGVDYEKVHALYRKHGRLRGSPVKGSVIEKVLRVYFGKTLSSSDGSNISEGDYIGITEDHAFAIKNGEIFDSTDYSSNVVKYVVRVNDGVPDTTFTL